MYLKMDKKKNGRVYLSITESFRDASGKSRNRTVRTLGYLDELEKQWGQDALEQAKKLRDELTSEHDAALAPVTVELHLAQKVDKRTVNRKCVGDAVALAYYDALGIESAVRSKARSSKVKFDVNSLLRLLVSERLLFPGSKHAAFENACRHFFKTDLSEADVYRGLDEIARMSESIISKMNTSLASAGMRDLSLGYYDCTNYYFESDADDFRQKGVSKEHRPNPIVQMGLMQDKNGIPVDFHLFSGNTHDDATLLDALPEAKRACGMKRVVTVADKGMNCSKNIIATVARGDGFVFSQSIRGTKSRRSLREWVLSDEGYTPQENGEFKMKARQDTKTITVSKEDSYDGKEHKEEVDVLVVAFWSRKYAERARHEREKVLEKARELVTCPGKYTRATHLGAAKYVKNIEFDKDTGEVLNNPKAPELDYATIEADEACDGYYCIITSETDWEPKRVIDTYRELWRIEETFKVTKSYLKARPVFVWTPAHIQAHFLTCYIALTIERIIEHALGHTYSAGEILTDMRALECSDVVSDLWLFNHRTDLTDKLFSLIEEEAPHKFMRYSDIKALFKKGKKVRWKAL